MEHCEFKNVGSGKPCAKKPVKKSKYCSIHLATQGSLGSSILSSPLEGIDS